MEKMDMDMYMEDFNQTDVKAQPRFVPNQKKNVHPTKKKVQPKNEKVESSVKVKMEKVESVEDSKAESILKMKTEKVEPVEFMNVDEEDSKMSVDDGGPLSNVVEDRVESKAADVEEEEDYVVREIDVYFSPPPADTQYHVVQYPLRPSWRPYDFEECLKEIRFKPEVKPGVKPEVKPGVKPEVKPGVKPEPARLEIDIQHDYASSSQRESHSRKQTLISSTNSSSKVSHAIGVLQGNKLYVCPVKAVLQVRPKMEFAEDGVDSPIEENVDGRGTKKLKDIAGKRPVASSKNQDKTLSSNKQNTVDQEPWIPLTYHGFKSEASAICIEKLMAVNQSEIPSTINQRDYLNSFFPKKEKDNMAQKIQSLRSLPLEERLKKWLCEGNSQAFKFSILKHLAPEASDEDVIKILEKYAVLVQGLWVPNTSILLPDCHATDCNAVARDFVILKFSRKLKFTHAELDSYGPAMRSSLKEALKGLGIDSEVLKSWKMKEPADPSFEKLYSVVAMRQKQVLEALKLEILPQMKKHYLNKGGTRRNAWFPVEKQEALLKALRVLFKSHSVHSVETIGRGLRDMAVSASSIQNTVDKNWMTVAATCVNSPEELKGVIREFAVSIHGLYVAKSSLTSPELNPLRNVVIQLLQRQPVNGKLKKAEIMKEAIVSLKQEVSNNDFLKVMNELCESSSTGWMFKKPH